MASHNLFRPPEGKHKRRQSLAGRLFAICCVNAQPDRGLSRRTMVNYCRQALVQPTGAQASRASGKASASDNNKTAAKLGRVSDLTTVLVTAAAEQKSATTGVSLHRLILICLLVLDSVDSYALHSPMQIESLLRRIIRRKWQCLGHQVGSPIG